MAILKQLENHAILIAATMDNFVELKLMWHPA